MIGRMWKGNGQMHDVQVTGLFGQALLAFQRYFSFATQFIDRSSRPRFTLPKTTNVSLCYNRYPTTKGTSADVLNMLLRPLSRDEVLCLIRLVLRTIWFHNEYECKLTLPARALMVQQQNKSLPMGLKHVIF